MREIKDIIAERRKSLDMTQEQLGAAIGVSGKVISKWETGRSLPSLEYVQPLSQALGVGVQQLLTEEDGSPTVARAREKKMNWFGVAGFTTALLVLLGGGAFCTAAVFAESFWGGAGSFLRAVCVSLAALSVLLSLIGAVFARRCRGNGFALAGLICGVFAVLYMLLMMAYAQFFADLLRKAFLSCR